MAPSLSSSYAVYFCRQMLHQGIMSVSQESNIVRKQISPLHLNVLLLQQPIFLVRQSYVYSCLSEKVVSTSPSFHLHILAVGSQYI